ncbi:putative ribonuclease H-like domain-containing protein [Tanacetum coccineum]
MKLVLPVEILEFNIAGGTSSTSQVSSTPGADEVVCSFFTQQTTSPPLDNEDLQQIDQDDLEELDIRWLVAMMGETIRVCRDSFRKTGRKLWISKENNLFTFDKSKVKCYNCHRKGHLCRECKSGRNYREKIFMGYGTQLDEMSNKSKTDSEISMSVFEVRSSDEKITPANDRFSKADGYHAVPPHITRNLLTPRADISFAGLDEYAIRKKIIESKTDTTKSKTSETVGKTNEVNIEKPKSVHESVVSKPKINRDKVIIKDWKSDDEDDVSSVKTVSLVKTNETQTVRNRVDKIGQISQKERIGFKKIKACFVCKRVLTRTGLVNLVRPNGKRAVHTVSTAKPISSARPISTARLVSAARPFASKKCTNCYKEALWLLESDPKGGKITGTQEHYVAGSSDTNKEPTQEYILLSLHPHRPRISVEDVFKLHKKNLLKILLKTMMYMIKTIKKKAAQLYYRMNNLILLGLLVSTSNSTLVSTDNTSYASAACTPLYDLEDESKVFLNDGIFSFGAYDDVDDSPPGKVNSRMILNQQFNKMKIQKASLVQQALVSYIYNQNRTALIRPSETVLLDVFFSQKNLDDISRLDDESLVIKALYGLHQAPRAWYETLSSFLLKNGFRRGTIDKTLFIKKNKSDIIFQMSSMGELTFFLGLQVKQQPDGIFISQDKSLIGSRWDSPFELEAFSDSDYGGASLDRKSTTGGCQFLGRRLISWQCKKQTIVANSTTEAEYVAAANCCGQTFSPKDLMSQDLIFWWLTLECSIYSCISSGEANQQLVLPVWLILPGQHLVLLGLVCAAQKYFTMEMMFGLGKKMLLGLVLEAINGQSCAARQIVLARQIWCCQAKVCAACYRYYFSMANLEFVDQHNMVACLEKTEGNSDFHEIVDFLASSSIHHALTVSPPIYTSYIEQFWNTASSQTVNDVKQINATVDSKAVVVTEASIRSSLLFNDVDALFSPQWKFLIHTILHSLTLKSTSWNEFSTNIASAVICLATNQKFNFSKLIFDGMLRNLDNTKKKFLMYPMFLMVFLNNQIELGEPFNDVYPTPAHNLKVFTNMSRKGLKFSGKITPLFPNMLTHAAKGEGSEQPTKPQPTPSPTQPSKGDQPPETSSSHATTQDSRDSLEGTNGNEEDQVQTSHDSPLSGGHTSDRAEGALNLQELSVLCTNLSNRVLALESIKDAQAAEISALKSRIKKLEKKCKPSISHHRAWLKSVKRLSMKKRFGKQESVSKQGRKKSKPESTLDDSTVFDDQDADHGMEYMETEEAVDEGRQSGETEEVKLTGDTEVVEDKSSGDKEGNAEELVSTARPDIDAARQEDSVVEPKTSPTTSIFDDEDITMDQTLIKMKEEKAKEKGVSIKDVDDSSRPARSILTLKPLPTIDPKDKGKGVLKESPVKKVKRSDLDAAQIAKDVEIARLVHEKELAKTEREREEIQRQDQAYVDYIVSLYDEVQAKIDASEELAARLQMEEREMYTIKETSKLLVEFFERRKKLLAEERVAAVRNKPPTRTQLRSLMMTYLKHTDFMPIGSERDEKMIDKMNKKAVGMDEEEVPEELESTKVEVKQEGREENIRKRSGRRLKMKATKKSKRQKTDSDLEEEEQLRASLKIVPDEEEEIDYEVLGTRYLIVNWESAFYHTDRYGVPHDYYRVFRANGSSRYIKTFTEMVSRFDRLDFIELHSLVMQRFSTTTPEGIDLVLWGDLRIMFEETADDDIWKNQEKWIIKSWTFYENCGVHILALEDGTEIHMLAERRYPLIRETLERMMELRLTAESEGEAVFDLLRFIQKQIDEFGGQDGSEKDL